MAVNPNPAWEYLTYTAAAGPGQRARAGGGPRNRGVNPQAAARLDPEGDGVAVMQTRQDPLNALGAQGWEAVGIDNGSVLFKRLLVETDEEPVE
jgi:hypothetical protein